MKQVSVLEVAKSRLREIGRYTSGCKGPRPKPVTMSRTKVFKKNYGEINNYGGPVSRLRDVISGRFSGIILIHKGFQHTTACESVHAMPRNRPE
ncbi:hypothetical protein BFP70_00175 [Thioclava sp. SK-1]|nr:hypothetical protein BFP70_00175 [Thioclava sp. SK-1]